tara:strand:+ start:77 stop:376 length:300 start_codon:yes stop_codon:yes gene_type:complete
MEEIVVKSKKKIQIEPLGRRAVILRNETQTETEGGIIIPGEAREVESEGTVVSVGDDCQWLKTGDIVVVPYACGTAIEVRGMEAVVVLEEDIQIRILEA